MFMGSKNSGPAGYSEVRNTPAAQSTHTHTHTHTLFYFSILFLLAAPAGTTSEE